MASFTAQFRFYEELNDFLSPDQKKIRFTYLFKGSPSIKDAIEAIGVPHTEIDLILVNGRSVDFHYLLQDGDDVSVYPVFERLDISPIVRLRQKPLRNPAFVLDVQLGRLAKYLRMVGFDTLYRNDFKGKEIIHRSEKEKRIILTRDVSLLKNKSVTRGCWIRSLLPEQQLMEVIQRFDLSSQIRPFQRCLICNGMIESVEKSSVLKKIPPKTALYFDVFYHCLSCGKIYWLGSHYERMKARISELMKASTSGF
jgi:uncharacterized protein with PIN domain